MKTSSHTSLVFAGAVLACSATAFAQDWPQWMGADRDSSVTGFQSPGTWPETLTKVWSVEVGDGVATPALVGDHLYVYTRNDTSEVLRCLNAATGEELWSDSYEVEGADGPARGFAGPRSSPTVAGGYVLTIGVRGAVSCHNAETGELLWRSMEIESFPQFYTSSSPLIIGDSGIAQLGSEEEGKIIAFDLATGEKKWTWTGTGTSYGSLAQMKPDDGATLIIAPTVNSIVAISAGDGTLQWEAPFVGRGRGGYNSATPIVLGQTVLLSGSGLGSRQTKVDPDAETPEEVWVNEDNSIRFNTPIAKGDLVFGISEGGDLFCINSKSGTTAWTTPTVKPSPSEAAAADADQAGGGQQGRGGNRRGGRGGGGAGYGSIVDAGEVMFALTPSAELIVFKPDATAYTEVARYKVAEGGTYAYPIISGGRVFIKDANAVTLWTIE